MARKKNTLGYNRTKRQTYKRATYKGPTEKGLLAKEYYKKHQKRLDKALDIYRQGRVKDNSISNEKIFEDLIKYGARDFGSAKQAKEYLERTTVYLEGGDLDWYDAKHGSNKQIFGDLRKLNGHNPKYVDYDYEYSDSDGNYTIEGYYETSDPDIVIAKVWEDNGDGSPFSYWEYKYKDEIGL